MSSARVTEACRSAENELVSVVLVCGLVIARLLLEPAELELRPVRELSGLVLIKTPQMPKLGRSSKRSAQSRHNFNLRAYCCSSFKYCAGIAFACARAAIEDCCRVWDWARFAASWATLASRMDDSAEEKLVICELARAVA